MLVRRPVIAARAENPDNKECSPQEKELITTLIQPIYFGWYFDESLEISPRRARRKDIFRTSSRTQ
jgi:hypothetical protein